MKDINDSPVQKLFRLNRANTKYGKAPHKPVLLITLIEYLGKTDLKENRFSVTPDLVALFRENWDLLTDKRNTPDFTLPFFHLRSDSIWIPYLKDGSVQEHHIGGFKKFMSIVDFGSFEMDIFSLLIDKNKRSVILNTILNHYFPNTKQNFINKQGNSFNKEIEYEILSNSPNILKEEDEELEYVRGNSFKKVIPQIYNYTCAFTGMRIQYRFGYSYVDACHIIPFTETRDDSISNGIALNPTIHRLFDKGLVSVDDDYHILISEAFEESFESLHRIKDLKGKKIVLPFGVSHYPSLEKLERHREKVYIR
jgi:putative restriction endonuclease